MLTYSYDQEILSLKETPNGNDVEFQVTFLKEQPYLNYMKQVQKHFEENQIITDVLFYIYENHEYRVIVRKDFYVDFILELMKHRLLLSVEWESN